MSATTSQARTSQAAPLRTAPRLTGMPGPLVAVCGLCGGAGTSTLAYLLARFTSTDADNARGAATVLLVDAAGTTAGLSLYAGVSSPRSLGTLADGLSQPRASARPIVATTAEGLRVIATAPVYEPEADRHGVARILGDARRAHELTVVDCGTASGPSARVALDLASHIVWVLPATKSGVDRASLALAGMTRRDVAEILVARRDGSAPRAAMRALGSLADSRDAALVLMPQVVGLTPRDSSNAIEACSVTLQAVAGKVWR
jgi:MinD-like ATPase involved in chromosome partitioning or flagellar assembly